jgi:8-oxo-dGTP diphosphatase
MHKSFLVNIQVAILRDNAILLLKRNGKWTLPGGRVEDSDVGLESALKREVSEETGIREIEIGQVIEAIAGENTLLLFYSARTQNSDVTLNHEHDENPWEDYQWVSLLNLDTYDFEYDVLRDVIHKAVSP